jgi:hypothetical protein
LLIVVLLASASLACTLSAPMPGSEVEVGPTIQREIAVDRVGGPGDTAHVELGMGIGELILRHGQGDALIDGVAVYNFADLEPQVVIDGTQVSVTQSADIRWGDFRSTFDFWPRLWFNNPKPEHEGLVNRWDLALGGQPIDLAINAGAYQADLELGGIALTGLRVSDGAASVRLAFSQPNPAEMETLGYVTGASEVHMLNLGNANMARMRLQSGAGSVDLDFGGELRQDAEIQIDSGLGRVRIVVPAGVPARAAVQGDLSEVEVEGDWTGSGSSFQHPGEGPALTFIINSSLGSVRFETR